MTWINCIAHRLFDKYGDTVDLDDAADKICVESDWCDWENWRVWDFVDGSSLERYKTINGYEYIIKSGVDNDDREERGVQNETGQVYK